MIANPPPCISGKSHRLRCQLPSTVLQVSEQNLIKELLVSYFYQWVETCPVLYNQNCTAVSSFIPLLTNQSISTTSKNTDQSGQYYVVKSDCVNLISHLHKNGLIRDEGRTFFIKRGLPFVFRECTFSSHWRLHLPSLQTAHLNKIFPFPSPQIGDSVGIGLVAANCW